jgi:hypothetical protein
MFTIRPSRNPHTHGRGAAFHVEAPGTTVMFDTYAAKPGITINMIEHARLIAAAETDEGCELRFENSGSEVIIILPTTLRYLRNGLDLMADDRAQ